MRKNKPAHAREFRPSLTFLFPSNRKYPGVTQGNHCSSHYAFNFLPSAYSKNINWFDYLIWGKWGWPNSFDRQNEIRSRSRGLYSHFCIIITGYYLVGSKCGSKTNVLRLPKLNLGFSSCHKNQIWKAEVKKQFQMCWFSVAPMISGIEETMHDVGINCLWTLERIFSFCLLSVESTEPTILGCSPPRRMGLLKYSVLLVWGQLTFSSCKYSVQQCPIEMASTFSLTDCGETVWTKSFSPLHSSNIKQKLCHLEMLCWDHNSFLRSQSNKSLRINFANSLNLSDTGKSLQYIWGFRAIAKWKIRNISTVKET